MAITGSTGQGKRRPDTLESRSSPLSTSQRIFDLPPWLIPLPTRFPASKQEKTRQIFAADYSLYLRFPSRNFIGFQRLVIFTAELLTNVRKLNEKISKLKLKKKRGGKIDLPSAYPGPRKEDRSP